MILVTGATGNVGRELVKLLLDSGEEVGAVTRDPGSAAVPAGARVVGGDPSRPATLTSALRDVEAVLLSPRAAGHGAAELLSLAGEPGARRVVLLSAVTVQYPAGEARFADAFKAGEDAVTGCGLDWTLLRCADFAANALAWAPQIRQAGVVRGAYADAATSTVRHNLRKFRSMGQNAGAGYGGYGQLWRSVEDERSGMAGRSRDNALDHVVVVVFENRSLDNVLGRLYGPEDGKTFEGVIGKDLTNPIPEWAEHGADRKVVPYAVATDMDSPNPDTGEEYPHTNTQLYGILSEANRFKLGTEISAPYNAPAPGQAPTMDGFVTDYISTLTAELGRQPTYEEYSQVMTGFTPEQIPVLSGLARGFGVFDHWFCEVPSQTFTNRSFWTAATASGFVVNEPVPNWLAHNTAETIFNRLEQHGKTWKVYVGEPDRFSATGLIHYPRLKDRFATHFVPFAQFEADAARGDLPDFSYIEPCLILGHGDYHPAVSRALGHGVVVPGVDSPSSILGGEAFLARIYNAYKGLQSPAGANVWNTALLIGWDEPGGTFDHVPPGPVPPPDPSAPAGQLGFGFDRSGYRVPAIVVSPWVAEGEVFNQEHRHTSLIATLREQWGLGDPLTGRDAAARTFSHAFTLDTPRDPRTWPVADPRPVPQYIQDALGLGKALSTLGKAVFNGIRAYAEHNNIQIEGLPADPDAAIPPEQALHIIHNFMAIQFPLLHPAAPDPQAGGSR